MNESKHPAVPDQKNPKNSDDGVLDSIGKAIADPVKSGAEEEEDVLNDGDRHGVPPNR